jgi:DNA-binding transcriptional ArsR family regulator
MNDDTLVSTWQDVRMTEEQHEAGSEPVDVRTLASVDALRAMADPTRLAILRVLMDRREDLPVMSVKELAARTGEPQTKLYRHVKQLEAAGLIRVASTRMVSGILEQRYQASQRDVTFDGRFLREHGDESDAAMQAVFDSFRVGFMTAFRDERLAPDAEPELASYWRPTALSAELRVSESTAAEVRRRLEELTNWLSDSLDDDPDGLLVSVLIGYYVDPADK